MRGVNEIPVEEIVKPTLSEESEPTFNLFKFFGNNLASSKNSPLSMSRTYMFGISGVNPHLLAGLRQQVHGMKSAAAGARWNLKMGIDQAVLAFRVALALAG